MWTKREPHTKPDKLRGGLCGRLTNQRPKVIPRDGLKRKLPNKRQFVAGGHVLGQ